MPSPRLPLRLSAAIAHLARLPLHHGLERYGIGRPPGINGDKPTRTRFASCPIGCFHIDLVEFGKEEQAAAFRGCP